ncbi:hypothetical protein ACMHYB_15445 [Sorangium sp. So ce1128]
MPRCARAFIPEGLRQGGLFELGGANGVEQSQKPRDRAADVIAALGHDVEEGLAATGRAGETIEAAVLTGAALLLDEALEVLGLLDLLAAVSRADVGRDDLVAIGDAHLVEVSEDDEHPVVRTE